MQYIDFQGTKLSLLGFGAMRLPTLGKDDQIDYAAAEQMIDRAMEAGINYFDTAYPYHGGNSELVTGKVLSKYPRDSYYIATKYPGHQVLDSYDPSAIFEEQLKKCGVDYFDFYLLHNISESSISVYLDERWGIIDYFVEQKRLGRIKHLGFSTHGTLETMHRFLDKYGEYMEFCQLQINWLDYSLQNAKAKIEMMKEYGDIPVWVMEPVRGGKLAAIDDAYAQKLKALRPDESIPAWAFRFIQTLPEVCVTLSGMSNFDQVKENIEVFSEAKPVNKTEWDALMTIASGMGGKNTLFCTGCSYCTTHCPMSLEIPKIIDLYNEQVYTEKGKVDISCLPADKRPSDCIGCTACEEVCPQNIKISEMMSDFAAKLK